MMVRIPSLTVVLGLHLCLQNAASVKHRSNDVVHEHQSASQHLLKAPAAFMVSFQAAKSKRA